MNYELRYELQGATQQWVDSFMAQHHISAAEMIDALNGVLVGLKDKAVQEMFVNIYQQQAAQAAQAFQNREEEIANGETNISD